MLASFLKNPAPVCICKTSVSDLDVDGSGVFFADPDRTLKNPGPSVFCFNLLKKYQRKLLLFLNLVLNFCFASGVGFPLYPEFFYIMTQWATTSPKYFCATPASSRTDLQYCKQCVCHPLLMPCLPRPALALHESFVTTSQILFHSRQFSNGFTVYQCVCRPLPMPCHPPPPLPCPSHNYRLIVLVSVVDPKLFIPDPDPPLNFPSSRSGSRQKFRIHADPDPTYIN